MQDDNTGSLRPDKMPPSRTQSPESLRPNTGDPLAPSGRIGAQLRALYDEIEREPVPTELIELLQRLDEAEERQKT